LARRFDVTAISNTGTGSPPIDLGAREVNQQLPIAEANGAYTGQEGSPIPVSGAGSSSGDNWQEIATYAWDCTDDGAFDFTSDQPTGVSCTYPDEGAYTVRLRVTETGTLTESGFTDDDTASVTVQNIAPTFSGQAARAAVEGSSASFPLGSFADPGADSPWAVTVDWDDSTPVESFNRNATGSLGSRNHTYADNGSYSVVVEVNDGTDTGLTSFTVNVSNAAPTVNAPADQTATEGISKTFSLGSFADPGADAPWNVTVDWGDSSPDTTFATNSIGTLGSRAHTYTSDGTYTVTVSVRDKDNGANSAGFAVTVAADDPEPGDDEQYLYLPAIRTNE
jgi:PKD repeat protein